MEFEAVIGLEIHAQLLTNTKIFCGCEVKFGSEPNKHTCPVCTGMPGVLPVLNKKAVEYVIKTGLALDCSIAPVSRFARKNYFYPDLPKGYQISQFELPLCEGGHVDIEVDGETKRITLNRIHLEEDAGKNIHDASSDRSSVDLNRAGTPLMEIVSEPDLRSAAEAAAFMRKLRAVVRCIGVGDGNMEQGSLRCDANISVRPVGQEELGVKAEIKNMNSFRFIEKAVDYEIKRQKKMAMEGEKIIQETRLWDAARGVTESMRSKEESHDYRYFPDPDLVPVEAPDSWVDEIRTGIPELPDPMRKRFISDYNLSEDDAGFLTSEIPTAVWFEEAVKLGGDPKTVSNWMMGELTKLLNDENKDIDECPIKPEGLVALLALINKGTISGKIAKTVFSEMYKSGKEASVIVEDKGLMQISDTGEIESIVDDIISKSPDEADRFKGGDQKLMGFFVGQVMKATKGKANPRIVNELIRNKLK